MAQRIETPTGRVYIDELRAALPNLSRAQQDAAIIQLTESGRITMSQLDNPREVTPARAAAVFKTPSGNPRHLIHIMRR